MSEFVRRPPPAPAPPPRPGEPGFIGPPDIRPNAGPTPAANGTTSAGATPFLNMYDPSCGPTTFSEEGDRYRLYACHPELRPSFPRIADGPSISAGSGGGRPLTLEEQRLVNAGLPIVPPAIQALRALGRDAGPATAIVNGIDSIRGDVRTERILSNQQQLAPIDGLMSVAPVPAPTMSVEPEPQRSVQSGPPTSQTYNGPPGASTRPRAGDPIMSLPQTEIVASEMLAQQNRLGGIETSASRAPGATDGVLVRGTHDGVTPPRGNVQYAHSHPGAAQDPRLELPSPPDIMGARRHDNTQAIVHDNGVSVFSPRTQVSEIQGMVGEHGSQTEVARRVNNVTVVTSHDVTISQDASNNVCLNPPNPTAEGAHLPIRIVQGDTYAPGTSAANVERLRQHQQQQQR